MKNQKQPFTSVEKIAAEFFFFKIHRKTPEQESHFNKPSYLKPAILLKKRVNKDVLQCHFRNVSERLLLITSQGDHFLLHIGTNKYGITNKDS